jgi:hypothetical protein
MKKNLLAGLVTGVMMLGMSAVAQANLTTIGTATYSGSDYNLIWDNDNNGKSVVWLDYSNGPDHQPAQTAWASGLNGSGVLAYNLNEGYSVDFGTNAWRLPTTPDGVKKEFPDYTYSPELGIMIQVMDFSARIWGYDGTTPGGWNITSSELGHLFYTELGNKAYYSSTGIAQSDYGLTSVGDFHNLKNHYWSTEEAANPGFAWCFEMGWGTQYWGDASARAYGLAVRSVQVTYSDPNLGSGATPTPEPATMLLMGTGLAGLIGARRKKKA